MSEFTPSRRAVVRTAAWTVPAVSIAAAAPAFAGSPPVPGPNLSTSTSGGVPTREGNVVTIAPSTMINTGDTSAEGLTVAFQTSEVVNEFGFSLNGTPIPPALLGITVTGLPGTSFTMVVPAGTALGQVHIEPGESWTSPASQVLTFATTVPSDLKVTATASNGGVPFVAPEATV